METLQKLARSLRTARASDLPTGKEIFVVRIFEDNSKLKELLLCLFLDNDSAFYMLMPMVMQNQHRYFKMLHNFDIILLT